LQVTLPLKTTDGWARGLLTLRLQAVGNIPLTDDVTNYWIMSFDAVVV
jgi:hypothetical protein